MSISKLFKPYYLLIFFALKGSVLVAGGGEDSDIVASTVATIVRSMQEQSAKQPDQKQYLITEISETEFKDLRKRYDELISDPDLNVAFRDTKQLLTNFANRLIPNFAAKLPFWCTRVPGHWTLNGIKLVVSAERPFMSIGQSMKKATDGSRVPFCDISTDSRFVSRIHAVIFLLPNQDLLIMDFASRNKTALRYVNNKLSYNPLPCSGTFLINAGEKAKAKFLLGDLELVAQWVEPTSETPSSTAIFLSQDRNSHAPH